MNTYTQLTHDGYFSGIVRSSEDPLDPTNELIPRNAFNIPLPNVPNGYRARWVDNAWTFEKEDANPRTLEQPVHNALTEVLEEKTETEWVDGEWVLGWTVRNKTAQELAAEEAQRSEEIQSELDSARSVAKVLLKISFLQENRIRALEGKQPVTAAQFRTWVNGQID